MGKKSDDDIDVSKNLNILSYTPLDTLYKNSEIIMDITSIANAATALNAASIQQEASIAVLKKAIDLSAEGALSLIQAIPDNKSLQSLPSHLGQNINTTA